MKSRINNIKLGSGAVEVDYDRGTEALTISRKGTPVFTADEGGVSIPGIDGEGSSLPAGGTTGQVLTKNSSTAGDASWTDPAGGSTDTVTNVAQNTLLGRVTAGSGDSEELTPAQARTLLNVEDGAAANQTGTEIVSAIDAELGSASWQSGGGGTTNLGSTPAATQVTVTSSTGTDAVIAAAGANAGVMTAADKTKLDGIEAGATAGGGSVSTGLANTDITSSELTTLTATAPGDNSYVVDATLYHTANITAGVSNEFIEISGGATDGQVLKYNPVASVQILRSSNGANADILDPFLGRVAQVKLYATSALKLRYVADRDGWVIEDYSGFPEFVGANPNFLGKASYYQRLYESFGEVPDTLTGSGASRGYNINSVITTHSTDDTVTVLDGSEYEHDHEVRFRIGTKNAGNAILTGNFHIAGKSVSAITLSALDAAVRIRWDHGLGVGVVVSHTDNVSYDTGGGGPSGFGTRGSLIDASGSYDITTGNHMYCWASVPGGTITLTGTPTDGQEVLLENIGVVSGAITIAVDGGRSIYADGQTNAVTVTAIGGATKFAIMKYVQSSDVWLVTMNSGWTVT